MDESQEKFLDDDQVTSGRTVTTQRDRTNLDRFIDTDEVAEHQIVTRK